MLWLNDLPVEYAKIRMYSMIYEEIKKVKPKKFKCNSNKFKHDNFYRTSVSIFIFIFFVCLKL